jgi:hypothetical protein
MQRMSDNHGRRGTRLSARLIVHALLALLGWIHFAYFWRIVSAAGLSTGAHVALTGMVIFFAILLVATTWWVVHNLRIGRRNRRSAVTGAEEKPYELDKTGFVVVTLDPRVMKSARLIEIAVEGSRKLYRLGAGGDAGNTAEH